MKYEKCIKNQTGHLFYLPVSTGERICLHRVKTFDCKPKTHSVGV